MWTNTFPFILRLAIGYFPVENKRGAEGYKCRYKFGDHSLLLCFGVSLREIVFKLVGRPVGKTTVSNPHWCYAYARVCKGAKIGLVWGL